MTLLYTLLLGAAFALIQLLIGGTRLLFLLPAAGFVGTAAALSILSIRRRKPAPDGLCVLATVGFAGYVMGRALTSPVVYLAWPDLFSAGTALAVYLLTACLLTDPGRRLGLLGILLGLAVVQLLVGARQFAGGDSFMLLHWQGTIFNFLRSQAYLGRASGLYICPNHLAGYLEVVGSLGLAAALWSRARGWVKLLLGYCALACFAGLLLTGSRGGFLSSAAALATLGVLGLGRTRATTPAAFPGVLLAAVIATALLAGVGGGLVWKSRLLKTRAGMVFDTKDVRPWLWQAAWRQFQTAPVEGTGSGTHLYWARRFREPRVQNDPVHAHGDYLELLAEYGLIGGGAFALFLVAHLRAGFRDFRALLGAGGGGGPGLTGSNAAALNLGALAAVVSYLVHSVFDFNLHIPANAMLMAFVCALLANPGRALPTRIAATPNLSRERQTARALWPRLLLPALGVWLLAAGLPRLPGEYWSERARVALRDKQWLECINLTKQGLEVESRNPDLFFYLAEARAASAQSAANPAVKRSFLLSAVEAYEAGRRLFPSDVRLLVRLGIAQSLLDQPAEAEATLREAVRWDPESGRTHAAYAFALQRAGRLAAAEEEYVRAASLLSDPQVRAGLEEVRRVRAAAAGG